MADLKGIPVSSLPSASSLESDDQVIAYRSSDNQAYRANVSTMAEAANGNISDAFAIATTYEVGDYCIYNDTLYKCIAEHTGSWSDSDFEAVTVAEELNELNTNLIVMDIATNSNISLSANSIVSIDINVAKDGYTMLGVIGFNCFNSDSGGTNSSYIVPYGMYRYSASVIRVNVRNVSSYDAKFDYRIRCLYLKNV